jgi:uncharacterized membrane protein
MAHVWTLQRNCALTPRQAALAYALACCASLGVALAFLLQGIWLVLAFALAEVTLVGLAFLAHARHAADHERIALLDDCLLVESVQADQRRLARLDPLWTRVVVREDRRRARVRLESRGVAVEIGRFVSDTRRRQVAHELRSALHGLSVLH